MTGTKSEYFRVNALAGAGKTYTAIRWATKFAHHTGQKFLIVQPSKNLIDESYADCLRVVGEIGARIKVTRMYGEHEGDTVTTRIVDHLKTTPAGGEILLITQAAFFKCPYFHNRENWTLIVDEIPQVDKHWDFKLPRTHTLLTDALEVTDHDPLHYLVTTKDEARLKHFRRNPDRDQIYAMFSEVADCVLSPDWSVYVRKEHWERYRYAETDGGRHTLAMFAMLDPSIFGGFRATIVMGAMFEESLMSLYWASKGIQFEPSLSIESHVRYHQHDNGGLITFKYVLEEDWSKRLRDIAIDDQSLMDVVIDAINGEFHGQKFLWVANNDIDRNPFPNGIRLPGVPNGLNQYQHIDHVVFLSALNRYPSHYAFLRHQGLDAEWVKIATGCQMAYQAMMRSSVRDPASTTAKTIVVPDKRTAEYLASYFPGCHVGLLGGEIKVTKAAPGRKAITGSALSPQQKKVRERAEQKRQILADLLALSGEEENVTKSLYNSNLVTHSEIKPADLTKSWKAHTINLFDSIYSAEPSLRLRLTNDELINQLRECHTWATNAKTANALVAAADFDPNKAPDTKRGIANITYVNGVWFDNDGGDLNPDEFHRLFPDLRLVVFNTFSGGNRWRAFIPTKQVMTVEAHQIIVRTFDAALRGAGYYSNKNAAKLEQRTGGSVKRHGFDTSKFTASSLFYLPCIAKDGTSFFHDWPGKEIDPIQWVERAVVHDRADPTVVLEFEGHSKPQVAANCNEVPTWTDVDDCPFINRKRLDQYRATMAHTDERYTGLFSMAASIIKGASRYGYQLSHVELEGLLIEIDNSMGGYHQGAGQSRIRDCVKNALRKVA